MGREPLESGSFCIARTQKIGGRVNGGKKSAGCEAKTITEREKEKDVNEDSHRERFLVLYDQPCITSHEQALSQTGAKRAKVRPGGHSLIFG